LNTTKAEKKTTTTASKTTMKNKTIPIKTALTLILASLGQANAQTISMEKNLEPALKKASKGQQMTASFSASQTEGKIGDEITATLKLHAMKRQTNVEISFRSGDCLIAPTAANSTNIKEMDKGVALNIKATFTIASEGPCWLNANVIRTKNDGQTIDYTAVYGTTINAEKTTTATMTNRPTQHHAEKTTVEPATKNANVASNP
jgi:uncharacterized protein YfcZ (UPF0381/DUF406 family)